MSEFNICTMNCRGLGEGKKRRDVFHYLRQSHFNIFMLQDIHCARDKENMFRNSWGTDILIAPYRNNARGVAILFKGVKVVFSEKKIDENGNYIIAKVVVNDTEKLILANVYGPNDDTPNFYEEIGRVCEELGEESTPFVVAGDFNMALNRNLDSVNYVRENNTKARDVLNRLMTENGWVDIFRERSGNKKKFTWRSGGSVIKQARLDYVFISRSLIPYVCDVNILPGYRTDHSIVALKMDTKCHTRGKGFYKMNSSLLQCEDYCQIIRESVINTLVTYAAPVYTEEFVRRSPNEVQVSISWSSFWETLILNMRTATLSFSIYKVRERNRQERNISKEIGELEEAVHNTPSAEIIAKLEIAKEKLESIRKHKIEGIITRSRAKWYEEGERSTAYFLNLEKRAFSDRLITSLKGANGEIITSQNQIITELVNYYTDILKKRTDAVVTEHSLEDVHVKQISNDQKTFLDTPLTLLELERALKKMAKKKSPGSDGFPVEFYQHFWGELKIFFLKMVQESVQKGALPWTLREGILTLVPKPNRPRSEIKSYRPITLLNVSYKIISTAVADKIREVLPSIIDRDQTGFMKGRFIGDNTRLTYDLLYELRKEKKDALLLSLDIEDAFNAVDWEFARIVMQKRNFPVTIVNLFNMLYVGSYSRLVYNGHISEKIMLERSCRQGDPLSPYIFLIVIECALEMIRRNGNIKGIKIGGMEYKISAYADDVLCFLDGNVSSCRALFHDLGVFAKYSGLKPNISKTQAFWVGPHKQQGETMNSEFNFQWTEKLKVLGIVFASEVKHAEEENFENKLSLIKLTINSWKKRYITLRGKITIVKSLLLPKLTHLLTSLPSPSTKFMKTLKTIIFQFVWGGKVDRLKRINLCKPYSEGGLAMVDIDTYVEALKATWARREIKSSHSWTILFRETMSKSKCLWELNGDSLVWYSKQISNPFWAEVLRSLASVSNTIEVGTDDINRYGLWHSNLTKHRTTCISSWHRSGMRYISDVIDTQGQIISFEYAKESFNISGSFLDYIGLINSLPRRWISLPNKKRAEYPVIHPQVECLLSKEKGAKYLYVRILQDRAKNMKNSWEQRWEEQYGQIKWKDVYESILMKLSVNYHVLSYKIITQIVATKRSLYLMGIEDSPVCSRCRTCVETIEHKFWYCKEVMKFWKNIANFIDGLNVMSSRLIFTPMKIIIGVPEDIVINQVIAVGKNMIAKNSSLNIDLFISKIKMDIMNEKCMAQKSCLMRKFRETWGNLENSLETM